jgi:hypothetical protein
MKTRRGAPHSGPSLETVFEVLQVLRLSAVLHAICIRGSYFQALLALPSGLDACPFSKTGAHSEQEMTGGSAFLSGRVLTQQAVRFSLRRSMQCSDQLLSNTVVMQLTEFLSADTTAAAAAFCQALSPPVLPAVRKVLQHSGSHTSH